MLDELGHRDLFFLCVYPKDKRVTDSQSKFNNKYLDRKPSGGSVYTNMIKSCVMELSREALYHIIDLFNTDKKLQRSFSAIFNEIVESKDLELLSGVDKKVLNVVYILYLKEREDITPYSQLIKDLPSLLPHHKNQVLLELL